MKRGVILKKLRNILCLTLIASMIASCGTDATTTISVSTAPIETKVLRSGYETIGVVEPQTEVNVTPKYAGKVTGTFKEVGDKVTTGETLLTIDSTQVQNQIKTQQSALAQANAGVASANTGVVKANTGVAQANVGLESAKNNLSTTENGSNEQTLLQYRTTLDNAKNSLSTAQITQHQANDDYTKTKTLYDAGAASQVAYTNSKNALDKANTAVSTAKTAVETAQKNLDLYENVMKKQTVDNAQSNIKNAKSSVDSASASVAQAQAGVTSAQAAVEVSKTQLEILQQQLADYTVTSPIDGVIIAKNVDTGETGQGVVYTISNTDNVTVTTSVPKSEIAKLSIGSKVLVRQTDGSEIAVTNISSITNTPNSANLYTVKLQLDNKNKQLITGEDVKLTFVESEEENIVVPSDSVVTDGKEHYIFVSENNVAKKVYVDILDKNSYEISISPIDYSFSENAVIVTENANMLKDGDVIEVKN